MSGDLGTSHLMLNEQFHSKCQMIKWGLYFIADLTILFLGTAAPWGPHGFGWGVQWWYRSGERGQKEILLPTEGSDGELTILASNCFSDKWGIDKYLNTYLNCNNFDGVSPGLCKWARVAVPILLSVYFHLPGSLLRWPLGAAKVWKFKILHMTGKILHNLCYQIWKQFWLRKHKTDL